MWPTNYNLMQLLAASTSGPPSRSTPPLASPLCDPPLPGQGLMPSTGMGCGPCWPAWPADGTRHSLPPSNPSAEASFTCRRENEILLRSPSICNKRKVIFLEMFQEYLAMYVGEKHRGFVIPTVYLSHPVFLMLLDKAHEEYGFKQKEGLTMPCNVEVFEKPLWLIECSQLSWLLDSLTFMVKASLGPDE
eukprot:Gb_00192 [translate_table: standard]